MSVWLTIPSCRPAAEATACFSEWRRMGYKIALLRQGEPVEADLVIPTGSYLGWSRSINILCREVLRRDDDAMWCVGGGDDTFPDTGKEAEEIGAECTNHFASERILREGGMFRDGGTYGVMQPTADRWQEKDGSALIDRIAGSPWMGRQFCSESYLGNGPMWDGYLHVFSDEELQCIAFSQGVFWQRRDLMHYHDHALRKPGRAEWPAHLKGVAEGRGWAESQLLFNERKSKGFPGSERITKL